MSNIIVACINGVFSLVEAILKYGFYTVVGVIFIGGYILYKTKPTLMPLGLDKFFLTDCTFFNIASLGSTYYIGIFNQWKQLC